MARRVRVLTSRAVQLAKDQKRLIKTQEAKIASLGEEFDGMCRFATKQTQEIEKRGRECENLKYKLQLNRDEIHRMADTVNLNHTTIVELRKENARLEDAKDPYYEARFRNECVKTQELGTKLWEQDGELERCRKEYDELVERHRKDAALWAAGFKMYGKISELSDEFESDILTTGLHDLNVRVGKLEAMHEWDEGNASWNFHTIGGEGG